MPRCRGRRAQSGMIRWSTHSSDGLTHSTHSSEAECGFAGSGRRRPQTSLAETRRLAEWSRQPEPDALEHEGLWSEHTSSTGCEVMRPSRLHGEKRAHASDPNAHENAKCRNENHPLTGNAPCEGKKQRISLISAVSGRNGTEKPNDSRRFLENSLRERTGTFFA